MACIVSAIAGALVVSYLFALAAQIASGGRHAALAGLVSKLGIGTAPMLGATIVVECGYLSLLSAMIVGFLLCAACVLPAAFTLDRSERRELIA